MTPLTREEVIAQFVSRYGLDISKGLKFRVVDNVTNTMAPERYSYKLSYVHPWLDCRERVTYWPNTVGVQG